MAAQGEHMVWLSGGSLVLAIAMIVGLFSCIMSQGVRTFWPLRIVQIDRHDGERPLLGEVIASELYTVDPEIRQNLSEDAKARLAAEEERNGGRVRRRRMRVEAKELGGPTYQWVSEFEVKGESQPPWAVVIERTDSGRLYGILSGITVAGNKINEENLRITLQHFQTYFVSVERSREEIASLKTYDIGRVNSTTEAARVAERKAIIDFGPDSPQAASEKARAEKIKADGEVEIDRIYNKIVSLNTEMERAALLVTLANGQEVNVPLATIVRLVPVNQSTFGESVGVYFSRWREFLFSEPRNANTEGGVLPAIWGTVAMTLLMSMAVAPFGVLAALYLREYAKGGWMVSAIRIAINNLAGVPSIVFGVFGLGFFCYNVGAFVDGGPARIGVEPLPSRTWFVYLFALAVCAFAAFAATLFGVARPGRDDAVWRKWLRYVAPVIWLLATFLLVYAILTSPYFKGFYYAKLPEPTFGKGGVLWASLTLSLLTLPVVIVATEEALSAVPNSMREGSYACGAGKWQTIRRIVLPHALPGIMTGMILAMARGAGEAAPLMLVGAVSSAPNLPVDASFPYVHADRSFMHLANLILFLGFQSHDSEAARPMVYTTALLLLSIVLALNITSIWLRSRLKKAFQASHF
jgi:ABC-type phosphate transport system permease subunit